jgi:hypothetical protein
MFLLQALTEGRAYLTGFLGALLPAAVGYLVSWYVTGYLNSRSARRNLVGMRLLALTVTVVTFLYCDVYIAAVDAANHADSLRILKATAHACGAVSELCRSAVAPDVAAWAAASSRRLSARTLVSARCP